MKKPEISIWFVVYVLVAFLVMTAITIHQDITIAKQKILIRQLYKDAWGQKGSSNGRA